MSKSNAELALSLSEQVKNKSNALDICVGLITEENAELKARNSVLESRIAELEAMLIRVHPHINPKIMSFATNKYLNDLVVELCETKAPEVKS